MTKNNKGVTMITLIVTILVISIIAGVTIYQSVENIKARKIDLLYADLELLEDKVNTYYLNNGGLPIKEEFKGSENFKTVKNVNDNDVYYVIDISSLDGVSLNMKLDFTGDDVYIMNEQSHTVYYPKGLTIDNETYYTLPKQYSKIEGNKDESKPSIGENETGEDTPIEPTLPSVDEDGLAKEDTTITTDDPNIQIVIPEGFAPVILQTDRTDSMPGENGAVKAIMPIEDWDKISAEQINKGIVVVDHAITYDGGNETGTVPDFNEYVWVPITDSSKFARIAWTTPYGYDENGSWGSGGRTHLLAEISTINKFMEETGSSEYTDMVDSVSRNKGFYISRYEASQKDSATAQSKRGQNPWVNVSQLDAKTASSNMKTSINSHLIYGIEWDSVLQWALDSGATIGAETSGTKRITIDDVQKDSRSWGNYLNSVGGSATNSGRGSKPGGTNEYWKVNNIYDIAGNAREWTQEKYSTDNSRVYRGGSFSGLGDHFPAAERYHNIESYKVNYSLRIQSRILCVALYFGSIVMYWTTLFSKTRKDL